MTHQRGFEFQLQILHEIYVKGLTYDEAACSLNWEVTAQRVRQVVAKTLQELRMADLKQYYDDETAKIIGDAIMADAKETISVHKHSRTRTGRELYRAAHEWLESRRDKA